MENIAGSTIPSRRLFVSFESSWEKWEDMELETALVDHFTCEYLSNTHYCHHHVACDRGRGGGGGGMGLPYKNNGGARLKYLKEPLLD